MRAVQLSAFSLIVPVVFACSALGQQQQNVPDAPAPQAPAPQTQSTPNAPTPQDQPSSLPNLKDVPPGKGTSSDQDGAAAAGQPAPQTSNGTVGGQDQAPPPDAIQPAPPATGTPGQQPYTIPV